MKSLLFLVLASMVVAEDSFITQYEYGEMLYENPRGIGCIYCHGKDGKGSLIATYKEDDRKMELKAPDIRHVSIKKLKKSLESRHKVMPTYFLTEKEIEALHYYLTHKE